MKSLRCNALKLLTIAALIAVLVMLWRVGGQVEALTVELREMNAIARMAMGMRE